jgi:hypothetical protein
MERTMFLPSAATSAPSRVKRSATSPRTLTDAAVVRCHRLCHEFCARLALGKLE